MRTLQHVSSTVGRATTFGAALLSSLVSVPLVVLIVVLARLRFEFHHIAKSH